MKISFKGYYDPTPRNIRKWGDAWSLLWYTISGSSILGAYPKFALFSLIVGAFGKFVSNLFTDNNNNDNPS